MILKNKFNYISIFFFLIFFLIGCNIFSDYAVTPDELLHRENGFISLKYIFELFSINLNNFSEFENTPNLYNDWRKTYGVIFDLPMSALELIFKIDIQNSFLLRHFFIFVIFFISNIYFFLLLKTNLKDEKFALLGVIILITTPRIFSHSFYNGKDIIFLSLMIIATYYCLELLKRLSIKNLILSCLFCALASNIRIIGIYLPVLTYIFFIFSVKNLKTKENLKFFFLFFFIYLLFLYISWPFLWENPIKNIFIILEESASYPIHWNFEILYLGNYINPENLPWHYFFVWFIATTPIFFLVIIFVGLFIFLKKYTSHFFKIKLNNNLNLWENQNQMLHLFIFMSFFIPIFFVITLNSTLYNGWRHLFFVYPYLIYLSIYGLIILSNLLKNNFIRLINTIIIIQILSNIFFIYNSHPVQNIYFNFISKHFVKNNLPIDYWGLGNKKTIDHIIQKNKKFSISNSSFTPLVNLQFSKNDNFSYIDNINFFGTQKKFKDSSDYVFTNYYYNKNPKNMDKFQIPKDYKSYYKLIINDIVVNEVFTK